MPRVATESSGDARMGKSQRNRTGRADKQRRRQARAQKAARQGRGLSGGWHTMDELDDMGDFAFAPPDEALLDSSDCPVGQECAGCGGRSALRVVASGFSRAGGFDIACATLCQQCDGRSFLRLLGAEQLEQAVAAHANHRHPAPV